MKTDVVIVGGGPGGAACSLFLQKAGIRSTIVEKSTFPRYHIGESMTGECGNCLRTLGLENEMISRRYPVKWGVSVYGPKGDDPFYVPVKGRDQNGDLFDASTWQVRRSDFDAMLLDAARSRGAEFILGEAVGVVRGNDDSVTGVLASTPGGAVEKIEASVVVDASGLSTFLSRSGVTGKKERGSYDNQVAIFSQVTGAVRDPGRLSGDTLIFYQKRNHWAWFIPIDDEIVSVGVVVPSDYFAATKESRTDFLTRELHELNPELKRRLPEISLTEEVRAISNYSYHVNRFTGPGYLCVGDAHRFIDPVFSFGLYFSIKEAEAAATAIEGYLQGASRNQSNPFAVFEQRCSSGMDAIQDLIDAFWNHPLAFAVLVHGRYRDDCIDMFAGRVYMDQPSPALSAFRKLNSAATQRQSPVTV